MHDTPKAQSQDEMERQYNEMMKQYQNTPPGCDSTTQLPWGWPVAPCPTCGTCPTCGRRNYPLYPNYPQPVWVYDPANMPVYV